MLKAVDLFCGAGGMTTGAEQAGMKVVLAVNHWTTAISSHRQNHPHVRHICARIEHIDARQDATLPNFDVLMAAPECTHHSIARGGRPVSDQSRQQPFALLDWIDAKRPKWVIVENVREFREWGPVVNTGTERSPAWRPDPKRKGETFRAWLSAIEACGYQADVQLLNAADFGAATKRVRLFVIARRDRCKLDIPWPEVSHTKGQWKPAYSVIDWSRPCPSIFSRKRPLADKTLKRIEIGLRKFVGAAAEPFMVHLRGTSQVASVGQPTPAITAGGGHLGLVQPFLVQYHGGVDAGRNGTERQYSVDRPIPTLDTQPRYALAAPFILPREGVFGGNQSSSIDQPVHTIVAGRDSGHLVVPYLLDVNHAGEDGRGYSVESPISTVSTKNGKALCLPFLTKYYGTGGCQSVHEPIDTITTKDRYGLTMASLVQTMQELRVVDIGFRMLDVDELARAQGFPENYYLHGTKADQVKQVGNAVCPPVAEAICRAIAGA